MTDRSVVHSTFTLERTLDHSPARVFAAWADPALKNRWFGGGTDDAPGTIEMDFRVGGVETNQNEPGADFAFAYWGRYSDIVPDERIAFTYDLSLGGSLVSVSVATVELEPTGDGGRTRLTYTEHGAFFDGLDDPELRKNGTAEILDELGHWLERQAATA